MSDGSDIESVKARILAACETAKNTLGVLQGAQQDVEKASTEVQAACNGSSQADAQQVAATFNEAATKAGEAQQGTQTGIQQAEAIAARL